MNVRPKVNLAHQGKQPEKSAKRALGTLSKHTLSRGNLVDSLEREHLAKRTSNNTVERAGAAPKLSLPDVYRRPQRAKGVMNAGSVSGSGAHNQDGRQLLEQENGGVAGAARRSVQRSQVLIQQKFHNLNGRGDPAFAAAEKGGAVGAYAHGPMALNGRFKSSVKRSYKNQLSPGVE